MSTPVRLLRAIAPILRETHADAGIRGVEANVRVTVDLAEVRTVREDFDFDKGEIAPGCIIEYVSGEEVPLLASYDEVDAAWHAYRTHADSPASLIRTQ